MTGLQKNKEDTGSLTNVRKLVLKFAAMVLFAIPAAADPRYEADVNVDVTAATVTEAKKQAMAKAVRDGLNEVVLSISTAQSADEINKLNDNQLQHFVSGIMVLMEKSSDVRYIADLRISVNEDILKAYLAEKGVKADLHVISGSVEIAPGIGLADAIFDIVSSGSTLVSNQLKEVEVIMQSEALLIANNNLSDEKQAILNELLFRFEAIQVAEGKKYVLLNAPKDKMDEIIEVLPGMKSPTITPLADGNWVSVQSVIAEKHFWEIIGKLKSLGAEGILVLPIEKMIL